MLERGYALCWREGDEAFLRSAEGLQPGETIMVQLAADRLASEIVGIHPGLTVVDDRKRPAK
ncbi:MAG: hypothetical protein BWY77_01413 [bacterium ADurb.Bin431]|nr:MAG: hypothetical protein BWY77_01413 [bacterium ADurb.Bin431]